jgi:L-ascorbate metabolism protein UlaG (beta-lactamase superfamily)
MVIYIDPNLVNAFKDSADVVLITHEHSDHNDLSRVKRKASCTTIRAANALISGVYQTFTIGKVTIRAVPAYNSYHVKSQCVGYLISFPSENGDTIKIYHPGDTGKITEMEDLTKENITYAFYPMDGTYTMTPEVATEAAAIINAKHDIPIHTLAGIAGYSDAMVARFTSPNKLVMKPGTTIVLSNTATSVEEGNSVLPNSFGLLQNYPNPFNPTTNIGFRISDFGFVTLKVYDILGKEIATLINEEKPAGSYSVSFNGSNLPSGVYIYRIQAGGFTQSRKLVLLK